MTVRRSPLAGERDSAPRGLLQAVHFALLTLALTLALAPTTRASYQAGLDAFNAGDHATAYQEWITTAAQPPGEVPRAVLAETRYAIGMLYWTGQGVKSNPRAAADWFRLAAELGQAGAQTKLGYLYTEGIGVEQDYAQAFEWFNAAARQGDVDGLYNLGLFYLNGWGTEQDTTMAVQYLSAASAHGDEAAEQALKELLPQLAQAEPDPQPDSVGARLRANEPESEPEPSTPVGARLRANDPGDEPGATEDPRHSGQAQRDPESIFLTKEWILEQNPDNYTVQVIGLLSREKLESLVQGHEYLQPMASYELFRKGKPLHILVHGTFANVAEARAAVASFPRAVQKRDELWIRKFDRIQALIRQEETRR